MFIFAEKIGFVVSVCIWFLEPASSGLLENYSFYHFHIGFMILDWSLLLGSDQMSGPLNAALLL